MGTWRPDQQTDIYFRLVLEVLLSALDISVNLFSNQKLGHVLINVRYHGQDWGDHFLLPLDRYPDVLGIVALVPGINRQGLGGRGELVGLGSCPHVIYATLQVVG